MTTIHVPMVFDGMYTYESYEGKSRYRWTIKRFIKSDGEPHLHVDCVEVPDEGNLLMIMEGPDVDEIATRDLIQAAQGRPKKIRQDKPDIQRMYQHFNEIRQWELSQRRVYPVVKVHSDGE